jgi:hypothetical protein
VAQQLGNTPALTFLAAQELPASQSRRKHLIGGYQHFPAHSFLSNLQVSIEC